MPPANVKLRYQNCRGLETQEVGRPSDKAGNSRSLSELSFDGESRSRSKSSYDEKFYENGYSYTSTTLDKSGVVSGDLYVDTAIIKHTQENHHFHRSACESDQRRSSSCQHDGVLHDKSGISVEGCKGGTSFIAKLKELFKWKNSRVKVLTPDQAGNCVECDPSRNQTKPTNCPMDGRGAFHVHSFDTPHSTDVCSPVRDNFVERNVDNGVDMGEILQSPTVHQKSQQFLLQRSTCNRPMAKTQCRKYCGETLDAHPMYTNWKHDVNIYPRSRPDCHTFCNWSKNSTANDSTYPIVSSSRDSRWRRCSGEIPAFESPADRLVGLTLHCVILSLIVMAEKVTRWASRMFEFCFYLALHSAVYKGKISPIREDTSEPVTRQQLRDATMFDAAGLKIILLQYPPPRRLALEYSSSSGPDSTCLSTDSAAATSTTTSISTRKPNTPTNIIATNHYHNNNSSSSNTSNSASNNNYHHVHHHQTAASTPQKSNSLHSGSSQDLSHIFSVSSS